MTQENQKFQKTLLYERVAADLRTRILASYLPGDRLPITDEFVKTLGVSWNTVRHAFELLKRQGLIDARQGSGTFVCQRPPRCVAIVIEQDILHPLTSCFFTQLPRLLGHFLGEHGIRTRLYIGSVQAGESITEPTCWSFIEDLKDRRFDAVAILGTPAVPGLQDLVKAEGMPVVGSGVGSSSGFKSSYPDMVRDGMKWLSEQGCRRTAVLFHDPQAALASEIAVLGMEGRPGWLQSEKVPQMTGSGWEGFRQIWYAYPDKPDGLLVTDDILFRDAQLAIAELGIRVPERLKVVTHATAGSPVHSLFPVCKLEVDPGEAARAIASMLLRLLNGEAVPEQSIPLTFRRLMPGVNEAGEAPSFGGTEEPEGCLDSPVEETAP